jgi:hypothetical protein
MYDVCLQENLWIVLYDHVLDSSRVPCEEIEHTGTCYNGKTTFSDHPINSFTVPSLTVIKDFFFKKKIKSLRVYVAGHAVIW